MAENKNGCQATSNAFKEAVCIDAGRVYDSCCDRDCLQDMRCYFSPADQSLVNDARSVRVRSAEVKMVDIDVEPVSFNKGYYSCDLTFFFTVEVDLFMPNKTWKTICGMCMFNKKVILYGSEGTVKTFSNSLTLSDDPDFQLPPSNNAPHCVVQCVEPVALNAKICELRTCYDSCCIPCCLANTLGGILETGCPVGTPTIYVTLGLFTIVQLIRNVQMLIPVYDFCIPEKQCIDTADEPCELFNKICFPTDDFFPPRPCHINDCGCGEK